VSLVLEALKKLDREKGRDERGFVVMAAAPWPTRAARRWPAWAALGVATAGAIVAVMALRTSSAPPSLPVPPATSVAAAPAAPAPVLVRSEPPAPVPRSAPAGVAPKPAVETPPLATALAPPARAATPDPGPRLQAISQRDGQPIAMINDHLVRVGDEIDGLRVIAIRVDEVDIEVRGQRTTLRF
jgi:hypothetical protein